MTMKNLFKAPFRFTRAMYHAALYKFSGNPVMAPEQVRAYRRLKCFHCPHRQGEFCTLCSCIIKLKTSLSCESCPDTPPRWKALAPAPPADDWDSVWP